MRSIVLLLMALLVLTGCPTGDSISTDETGDKNENNGGGGGNNTTPVAPTEPQPTPVKVDDAVKEAIKNGDEATKAEAISTYVKAIGDALNGSGTDPLLLDLSPGTTLKIPAANGGSVSLTIPKGKEIVVGEDVTLDLSAGTGTVKVEGTIRVPDDASIKIDADVDYFGESTGQFELAAGSFAIMTTVHDDNLITNFIGSVGAIYTWGSDDANLVLEKDKLTLAKGTLVVNEDPHKLSLAGNVKMPHSVIKPGDEATIADGATLKIADKADFILVGGSGSDGATFNVEEGGTVEVASGGTFTVQSGAKGELNGTIIVGDGGTLKDLTSGGGSFWGAENDKTKGQGEYIIKAGAKVESVPSGGTSDPVKFIDKTGDDVVLLLTGEKTTLTMKKGGYVLDGPATLQKPFGVEGGLELHITETSVLTFSSSSADVQLGIKGKITLDGEIKGTSTDHLQRIVLLKDDNITSSIIVAGKGTNNFYKNDSDKESTTITLGTDNQSGNNAGGHAYYEWKSARWQLHVYND
jgi:hypothetical protein